MNRWGGGFGVTCNTTERANIINNQIDLNQGICRGCFILQVEILINKGNLSVGLKHIDRNWFYIKHVKLSWKACYSTTSGQTHTHSQNCMLTTIMWRSPERTRNKKQLTKIAGYISITAVSLSKPWVHCALGRLYGAKQTMCDKWNTRICMNSSRYNKWQQTRASHSCDSRMNLCVASFIPTCVCFRRCNRGLWPKAPWTSLALW